MSAFKQPRLAWTAAVALLAAGSASPSLAAPLSTNLWQYTLLPASQLRDSCDLCGLPAIIAPLRGTFTLQPTGCDPLHCHYAWFKVSLSAHSGTGASYFLEGEGSYQLGGEVAVTQNLVLKLYTDPAHTNAARYFTNTSATVQQLWPMIKVSLDETNPAGVKHLRLDILAAPMREIWFSTRASLTDGFWQSPTNRVSSGDLLSSTGRIVKSHDDLGGRLGVMPPAPDLGLKDIDLLPGGEIAFSIEQDVFSETLGPLHQGDLVSDRGQVISVNAQLIASFDPDPGTGDVGLDAVQILDSGEVYFSVQTNFLSLKLGRMIGPGDLLSSHGSVIRSNADLLARFFPADPAKDYGLAAVYLWPSGEAWFATQTGFSNMNGQGYLAGDLLSDQGYVVYRNLELLDSFAPLEDVSNFGLDALFVVTDTTPPAPSAKVSSLTMDPHTGNATLGYSGTGRAWQLERSNGLNGSWNPIGAIGTEPFLTDEGVLNAAAATFYRFHQW